MATTAKKQFIQEGFIEGKGDTGVSHKIWYGVSGNSEGVPVVNVHGGPGSYSKESQLEKFDLEKFMVVQFDQRGCGKSLPLGELRDNTIQLLVEDMETLRRELGITSWYLVAGSWGVALSLAYAEKYTENVRGMLLRSPFLADSEAARWIFSTNATGSMYPELWEQRQQRLAKLGGGDSLATKELFAILSDELTSGNALRVNEAVKTVIDYEFAVSAVGEKPASLTNEDIDEDLINYSRIFAHYAAHDFFLEEGQLLANAAKLQNIPITLLHGRNDMVAPVSASYKLHKLLPHSRLEILEGEGHGFGQVGNLLTKYALELLVAERETVK
jgi:proline iminopeptidase